MRGAWPGRGVRECASRPAWSLSLAEVSAALDAGEVTSAEVVEECAARVAHCRASTNAWVSTRLDAAREEAAACDARWEAGAAAAGGAPARSSAVDGVPVGVKDNFATRQGRTTCASRMLEGYVSPFESACTEAWLGVGRGRAGAVSLGKTNMDEMGMGSHGVRGIWGPTVNPWCSVDASTGARVAHVAGGSSSGSAAAVASFQCFAALGSDTGGSVRLPAAFSGVAGFKPTYGRLSRHGLVAYGSSLDCPGILARSAHDAALCFAALLDGGAGADPRRDAVTATDAVAPVPLRHDHKRDRNRDRDHGHEDGHDDGFPEGYPAVYAGAESAARAAALAPGPGAVEDLLRGKRVGIPAEFHVAELTGDMLRCWEETAAACAALGADVVPVSLPRTKDALAAYYIIASAEAASNLARFGGNRYGHAAPFGDEDDARGGGGGGGGGVIGGAGRAAASGHRPQQHPSPWTRATRTQGFGNEVLRRILVGTFVASGSGSEAYLGRAMRLRRAVAMDFGKVFSGEGGVRGRGRDWGVDALLVPTAAGDAPKLDYAIGAGWGETTVGPVRYSAAEEYATDCMTVPFSLAGLPAISLPAGLSARGMPLGLQLVGRLGRDWDLLAMARALEGRLHFQDRLRTRGTFWIPGADPPPVSPE